MASAAAQKYFNSFSEPEKANIRASWGGNDAMMDAWFQNAVNAGAVGADGQPNVEQAFAKQIASGERDTDSYDKNQWGAWEEEERQLRKQGKSASQLTQGGCPDSKPFTSRPGPDGKVECAFKPDDCPEGSHVVGSGGNAKCVSGTSAQGGPASDQQQQQQPITQGVAGSLSYTGNPMVDMLISQFNSQSSLGKPGDVNLFGAQEGRAGLPTGGQPADVTGRLLKGGGLWWANTPDAANVFSNPAAVQAGQPKTPAAWQPESGKNLAADNNAAAAAPDMASETKQTGVDAFLNGDSAMQKMLKERYRVKNQGGYGYQNALTF